ncbi:MAG TPA: Uma2 family endonuclease [Planctomycetaceae bacterium]|nr:Uma2 family endonuclease [Planctomycetaceae bacterium]
MATAELVDRASLEAVPQWDEPLYEIVDGQQIEVPPMGARQNALASYLCGQINQIAVPAKRGLAVTETLFVLEREPSLQRRSDLAYVSYDRWPERMVPESSAWDVVPNLTVEVVSRTNAADEVETKRIEYFAAGVELVWIIYPATQTIHVCAGPRRIDILSGDDELDAGTVLPGFHITVADLFAALQAPE